jgi:hypothetical protein
MADKRLTQSPRAIREGNRDPNNVDDSRVQLGQRDPTRGSPENAGADRLYKNDERYKPAYEPR